MPKNFEITFEDNSKQFLEAFKRQATKGLEEIGLRAQGYAALNTPVGTPKSTGVEGYIGGTARQSITNKVVGYEVYVGGNLYYLSYLEYGTGIYASDGTGRKTPWSWQDKNGKWHWTRGIEPQHMILKAVTGHDAEFQMVMENILKF